MTGFHRVYFKPHTFPYGAGINRLELSILNTEPVMIMSAHNPCKGKLPA